MSRLRLAIEQLVAVRQYTNRLLDQTPTTEWFRLPPSGITHVAWQIGHLAMAEYRLTLERIRGPRAEDGELIDEAFLRRFGRDSVPHPDLATHLRADDIRAVFDRVHRRGLLELETLTENDLDQPVLKPHPLARTKLAALLWCAQHEMLHAGQIGLLRRQLGYVPLW